MNSRNTEDAIFLIIGVVQKFTLDESENLSNFGIKNKDTFDQFQIQVIGGLGVTFQSENRVTNGRYGRLMFTPKQLLIGIYDRSLTGIKL